MSWFKLFLIPLYFSMALLDVYGQTVSIEIKDSVKGEFSAFSVDNMGNVYLCNQDVITKLSPDLDTLFSTSVKSHFPSFIQAVKNFRVLTFDQERGIVQFFDNTLTPLSNSLNLYDLELIQPLLVCESFNGNTFWVLDAGTLRLLKISESFKIITEIENLSFLANGQLLPTQMFEYNDFLYITTADHYLMVFDAFGTFINKRSIKGPWLGVYQNALLEYIYPSFVFTDRLNEEAKMTCRWPLADISAFYMSNKFLYALSSVGLVRGVINKAAPPKNK